MLLRDYFSDSDLLNIEKSIEEAESKTSGEIRVKIIQQCDSDLDGNIEVQALREFNKEGLHNTKDKTGVLVLLVLGERRFKILGDAGIYSKIPQYEWNELARRMSILFATGQYTEGICRVVKNIGSELAKYFPRREDDVDELPNKVILGDDNENN